jgi:hypothetical protein
MAEKNEMETPMGSRLRTVGRTYKTSLAETSTMRDPN